MDEERMPIDVFVRGVSADTPCEKDPPKRPGYTLPLTAAEVRGMKILDLFWGWPLNRSQPQAADRDTCSQED